MSREVLTTMEGMPEVSYMADGPSGYNYLGIRNREFEEILCSPFLFIPISILRQIASL